MVREGHALILEMEKQNANQHATKAQYIYIRRVGSNALSFYVTKTVLVGPKWFWSDQIDLDLTIMIWSRPK